MDPISIQLVFLEETEIWAQTRELKMCMHREDTSKKVAICKAKSRGHQDSKADKTLFLVSKNCE
jgi:hypothetical protein